MKCTDTLPLCAGCDNSTICTTCTGTNGFLKSDKKACVSGCD